MKERRSLHKITTDNEGRPRIILGGTIRPENYLGFFSAVIELMDRKYGKDNYGIEDKIKVY